MEKGTMTLSAVNEALVEIRNVKDLNSIKEQLTETYGISGKQANFLVAVVAVERVEKNLTSPH
jgi:hypothetical protein